MEYVMFQETGAVDAITSEGNAGRSVEFKAEGILKTDRINDRSTSFVK